MKIPKTQTVKDLISISNSKICFLVKGLKKFAIYAFMVLLIQGCDNKTAKPAHDAVQMTPEHQAYLKEIEKTKAAEQIAVAKCQEQSWEVVKRKGLHITVDKDGATYYSRNPEPKTFDALVGIYHFRYREADRQKADSRYLHYASYLENRDGTVHFSGGDGAALFGLFLSLKTDIPTIFRETRQEQRVAEIKKVQFPSVRPEAYNEAHWEKMKARAEFHDDIKIGVFCRPNRESKAIWEMAQDEKTTIEEYLKKMTQYPHSRDKWNWTRSRPELGLEEYWVTIPGVPKRSRNAPLGPKTERDEKLYQEYTKPWVDKYRAIYIASAPKLRKPDGGLYTFYCRHPIGIPGATFSEWRNECFYHYYTLDGLMIHVDFSPHQIKFWREITQYIPTFIESINVKD